MRFLIIMMLLASTLAFAHGSRQSTCRSTTKIVVKKVVDKKQIRSLKRQVIVLKKQLAEEKAKNANQKIPALHSIDVLAGASYTNITSTRDGDFEELKQQHEFDIGALLTRRVGENSKVGIAGTANRNFYLSLGLDF